MLPLVAGLFVLVEALNHTGVIAAFERQLHAAVADSTAGATYSVGLSRPRANLMNNLPVGLIVGSVVAADNLPSQVVGSMLIGVDLRPNLSVTGSLETILWLVVLRREGLEVGTWSFLRLDTCHAARVGSLDDSNDFDRVRSMSRHANSGQPPTARTPFLHDGRQVHGAGALDRVRHWSAGTETASSSGRLANGVLASSHAMPLSVEGTTASPMMTCRSAPVVPHR